MRKLTAEHKRKMVEGRTKATQTKKTKKEVFIDAKRKNFLKQIEEDAPGSKPLFFKAWKGSLRAAVNAHCLECTWFDKEHIHNCTSTICPLWSVRPYQRLKGKKHDDTK